jgi:hypothetical protein
MNRATLTPREANNRADLRAQSKNHRAFQHGRSIKVVSDTEPDVWYRVGAVAGTDGPIVFECQPMSKSTGRPIVHAHGRVMSKEPGVVVCWHSASAARRLAREGLAERDDEGRWVMPSQLHLPVVEVPDNAADVFAMFPKL